jgi:hypothetical protein
MEKLSRISINESHKKEARPEMTITYPEKFEPKMIIEEKVMPKPVKSIAPAKEKELSDDDDELEIPAFIRRKMGK